MTNKDRIQLVYEVVGDPYQLVWNTVEDIIPSGWKQVIFFIGYTEGSYTMKFHVKDNAGKTTDCFHLPTVSRNQLIKTFVQIDKILSNVRNALDDSRRWTILTMIVSSDGKIRTEFDYGDHSEDLVEYENKWEKKYL